MKATLENAPGALFDPDELTDRLAQHPALPVCKSAIASFTEQAHVQFRAGADVHWLIRQRAAFVDTLLTSLWEQMDWGSTEIALIAVGGYGRGELHPHSDIDLLILLESDAEDSTSTLESFLTLLWDIGLDIGHSVRTLEECVAQSRDELTVVTNLMESRLLCGPTTLYETMMTATGPDKMWPSAEFFSAKLAELRKRHAKFADTEYNLEPNVKSSPGGLRDLQLIGWVAQRHFGIRELAELEGDEFLNPDELEILTRGRDYLWRTRYALHMLTGREEDRLLFDHQRDLAKLDGLEDGERLAVEHYMHTYYRWALAVGQLCEVLMQNFDQAILHGDNPDDTRILDDDFLLRRSYLEAREDDLFCRKPEALLRIFHVCANSPNIAGIGAATIRLIRDNRHLIDEAFRDDPANCRLFMDILRSPHKLARQLRRMSRYGILGSYLPEYGRIVGQMQHDLFHTYTVDAHTLEVVKNMRRFHYPDFEERFPVTCRVARRLPKPELLYLAGLYHDIGKGRGGDHSELGAVDARQFCQRHGLSEVDTNLVAWLVQSHLLMSSVAQRKDISDPEVIRQFATHVGDQNHLDYLLTLTVADINATNPTLWNAWRGSLLRQLYTETTRALRRGLEAPIDKQQLIEGTRDAALTLLEDHGFLAVEVEELWRHRGEDYFLREKPEDIAWHTESIAAHENPQSAMVLLKQSSDANFSEAAQIFIHAPSRPYLFSVICAELEQLDLSVHDARIYNSADGMSLDTFFVLDSVGQSLENDTIRQDAIASHIEAALGDAEQYGDIVNRRTPRQMKHFAIPTVTRMSVDEIQNVSVLEVATPDRPGLLARIGQVFIKHGIELQAAKIQTLGERVEDVFFITDREGEPITNTGTCQAIQDDISTILDKQAQA